MHGPGSVTVSLHLPHKSVYLDLDVVQVLKATAFGSFSAKVDGGKKKKTAF